MKRIIYTLLLSLALVPALCGPFIASAAAGDGGIVNCGRDTKDAPNPGSPEYQKYAQQLAYDCNFTKLFDLVNIGINYLILISMPIAAIGFAIAGYNYLTAGGDTGKVKRANSVFKGVAIGLLIILSAWLLFKFIAVSFLRTDIYGTYLK